VTVVTDGQWLWPVTVFIGDPIVTVGSWTDGRTQYWRWLLIDPLLLTDPVLTQYLMTLLMDPLTDPLASCGDDWRTVLWQCGGPVVTDGPDPGQWPVGRRWPSDGQLTVLLLLLTQLLTQYWPNWWTDWLLTALVGYCYCVGWTLLLVLLDPIVIDYCDRTQYCVRTIVNWLLLLVWPCGVWTQWPANCVICWMYWAMTVTQLKLRQPVIGQPDDQTQAQLGSWLTNPDRAGGPAQWLSPMTQWTSWTRTDWHYWPGPRRTDQTNDRLTRRTSRQADGPAQARLTRTVDPMTDRRAIGRSPRPSQTLKLLIIDLEWRRRPMVKMDSWPAQTIIDSWPRLLDPIVIGRTLLLVSWAQPDPIDPDPVTQTQPRQLLLLYWCVDIVWPRTDDPSDWLIGVTVVTETQTLTARPRAGQPSPIDRDSPDGQLTQPAQEPTQAVVVKASPDGGPSPDPGGRTGWPSPAMTQLNWTDSPDQLVTQWPRQPMTRPSEGPIVIDPVGIEDDYWTQWPSYWLLDPGNDDRPSPGQLARTQPSWYWTDPIVGIVIGDQWTQWPRRTVTRTPVGGQTDHYWLTQTLTVEPRPRPRWPRPQLTPVVTDPVEANWTQLTDDGRTVLWYCWYCYYYCCWWLLTMMTVLLKVTQWTARQPGPRPKLTMTNWQTVDPVLSQTQPDRGQPRDWHWKIETDRPDRQTVAIDPDPIELLMTKAQPSDPARLTQTEKTQTQPRRTTTQWWTQPGPVDRPVDWWPRTVAQWPSPVDPKDSPVGQTQRTQWRTQPSEPRPNDQRTQWPSHYWPSPDPAQWRTDSDQFIDGRLVIGWRLLLLLLFIVEWPIYCGYWLLLLLWWTWPVIGDGQLLLVDIGIVIEPVRREPIVRLGRPRDS